MIQLVNLQNPFNRHGGRIHTEIDRIAYRLYGHSMGHYRVSIYRPDGSFDRMYVGLDEIVWC